jgi:DNA-directed RNA polymerase specialized sigma24 family protein
MNDQLLVRRMLAADEHAFEVFFDAYFQRLFRFARARLEDDGTAEDIVQATLVTAIRKSPRGAVKRPCSRGFVRCAVTRSPSIGTARNVGL